MCAITLSPALAWGQDDGGDKKEKKEKPAKEKPEKAPKEKPEKAEKEKPFDDGNTDDGGGGKKKKNAAPDDDDADDGGDDGEKKKKKGKKGDAEPKAGGHGTANERYHQNNADSTVAHGYAVPCGRYHRGTMEFVDKNNVHITIRRSGRREVQYNGNRGMKELKTRKLTRDQKIDKSKSKKRVDKEGKLKDKGNKLVFKIEWQSDCEYKLVFIKSKKPSKFKKGWEMDCVITKCYEDYYDCDCDLHGIMQYASVKKRMTKSETAANARREQEAVAAKEAETKLAEEEKAKVIEEEARVRAAQDEVFGPIKRIQGGNINETPPATDDPNALEEKPTKAPEKPGTPGAKRPEQPQLIPPTKTGKEAKEPKEKVEKGDKVPKEKKEKASKEEKVPKEKKEKVPKEKKEKAPKEPKTPKEKPEKAPKEPKVKPEKAPKEDKSDE